MPDCAQPALVASIREMITDESLFIIIIKCYAYILYNK